MNNFEQLKLAINGFPQQFNFKPHIQNEDQLPKRPQQITIVGMGGSALAANLLIANPKVNGIRIHKSYFESWLEGQDLIIASSYSGNTEEILDVAQECLSRNINLAVIAHSGKLLNLARENNLPYIELPEALQPRYALGYSYVAMCTMSGNPLGQISSNAVSGINADSDYFESLARKHANKQVIIYSTPKYFSTAYVWKILTNETAKQLAWANKFPELNHNEIVGFEQADMFNLSQNSVVIILQAEDDHPRLKLRQQKTKDLIEERGVSVETINLLGEDLLERSVYGWQAGMCFTLELAKLNKVDPKTVAIIEDLKAELS